MKKLKIYTVALAALALISTGPVLAGWEEGVAAFQKGNLDQAASEFKAVVDAQPDWPGGHYMLGWTYLRAKRNQEAITHLRKAYDLDNGKADYQLRLGEAYVTAGRYADGVALLTKIDSSKLPAQAQTHLAKLKAVAYSKSGQTGQALIEFRRAAQAEPNNADLWFQYGALAFNEGDNEAAVTALTKAAQLDPGDADKQRSLAQALLKKGRTTRGSGKEAVYKQAATAAGKLVASSATADNLILLGECQLGAKQYDAAIDSFEKAAGKSGSGAWLPHFYIGQAYTAKEQYRSAEIALRTALDNTSNASDQTRVWKQLGFVYEKQKNFDEAITAYTRAGDSTGANRARENKKTEEENRSIEAENRRLAQMEEEKKRLEEELKKLPGGPPPR